MSTSLFSASSAAFPKPLPPWCRRSQANRRHRQGARDGVGQARPRVHAPAILRSDAVVLLRACLESPRFSERSEGWR